MRKRTEESFEEAARAFDRLEQEMEKAEGVSLVEIGHEIMTDVKASRPGKGVPVDKGPLRASGAVEGPDERGEVTLAFGGPAGSGNHDGESNAEDVGYAIVQHEDVTLHHETGEARYLVRGVERWRASGSSAMRALRENFEAAVLRAADLSVAGRAGAADLSPTNVGLLSGS